MKQIKRNNKFKQNRLILTFVNAIRYGNGPNC